MPKRSLNMPNFQSERWGQIETAQQPHQCGEDASTRLPIQRIDDVAQARSMPVSKSSCCCCANFVAQSTSRSGRTPSLLLQSLQVLKQRTQRLAALGACDFNVFCAGSGA